MPIRSRTSTTKPKKPTAKPSKSIPMISHRGLAQTLLTEEKFPKPSSSTSASPSRAGTPENYLRLSQIYRRMNQVDEAEESIVKAKQLGPGNLEIVYNEALRLRHAGPASTMPRTCWPMPLPACALPAIPMAVPTPWPFSTKNWAAFIARRAITPPLSALRRTRQARPGIRQARRRCC